MNKVMQLTTVDLSPAGKPDGVFWQGKRYRILTILDYWTYTLSETQQGFKHERYLVELETLERLRLDHNCLTDKWLITHASRHTWFRSLQKKLRRFLG